MFLKYQPNLIRGALQLASGLRLGATMRRFFSVGIWVALALSLPLGSAVAQTFPAGASRVTIVVPFPPGGPSDIVARSLADELAKLWKLPVIVENVGGAGGLVGTARAAKAQPDGQTLLVTVQETLVHNRFLFKNLPYDPDKSLTPITMVGRSPQFLIINPSVQANNVSELIELARRTPGGLTYGSSGLGSGTYIWFEALSKRYGLKFVHVPYKGQAPTITAVMTGEVQMTTGSPASSVPFIEDGKVKALAIGGETRWKRFPNVPTMTEAGLSNLQATTWWGIFAPEGASPELVNRVNRDVASIVGRPEFVERYYAKLGIEPVLNSPAEFAAAIRKDVANVGEMAKAAELKPIE